MPTAIDVMANEKRRIHQHRHKQSRRHHRGDGGHQNRIGAQLQHSSRQAGSSGTGTVTAKLHFTVQAVINTLNRHFAAANEETEQTAEASTGIPGPRMQRGKQPQRR